MRFMAFLINLCRLNLRRQRLKKRTVTTITPLVMRALALGSCQVLQATMAMTPGMSSLIHESLPMIRMGGQM